MFSQQWHAMKVICSITLRQVFWTKKTIGMVLLACLPIALVVMQRLFANMGTQQMLRFFPELIVYVYVMFISMLFALFYASAVVSDEVENRTLTYLMSRPVKKSTILLSKYLAYLCGSLPMVLLSLLSAFLVVYTHPRMSEQLAGGLKILPQYALVISVSLLSYGAVYLLFGTRFRRPVLYGLLLFGWEKIVIALSGVLRKLSVIHYLLSVMPESNLSRDLRSLRTDSASIGMAWVVLLVIAVVFVFLAVLVFSSREYRFTES